MTGMEKNILTSIIAAAIMLLPSGCREDDPVNEQPAEEFTNEFVYDGESYNIGSVVRFDQDNNTTQLWISSEEGLESIDQIEDSGDYLVLSVHRSYLGSRDRFTKAGSFVRFGSLAFASGNEGMGYIETAITGEEISIIFAVDGTGSSDEEGLAIEGNYKGGYSTFIEEELANEWALDRDRNAIGGAAFLLREDGGSDTYTIFDSSMNKAIEFTLPQSRRGLPTLFNTTDKPIEGASISYGNGEKVDMSAAYGSITAMVDETSMRVSFDITAGTERIRAEYEGQYDIEIKKSNRYIYNSGYPYSNGYDGMFILTELRTEQEFGRMTLKFIPEGTDERYSDIPELTISDFSLIGQEKIDLRNTPGWYFEFDRIAVECYDNEWKPAPMEGSWMTILESEDNIIINMELATEDPAFKYISTIDLYYEGPISK